MQTGVVVVVFEPEAAFAATGGGGREGDFAFEGVVCLL